MHNRSASLRMRRAAQILARYEYPYDDADRDIQDEDAAEMNEPDELHEMMELMEAWGAILDAAYPE